MMVSIESCWGRMLHCIDVFLAVIIEIMNCTEKCFVRKFLFFKHHTESLTLERTGVENLITTACIGRQRNQKIWFVQGEKLADSIGSGSGDYNVGQCEEVTQLFFDIFELCVAFRSVQRRIELAAHISE